MQTNRKTDVPQMHIDDRFANDALSLTRNERLVADVLIDTNAPMKAYEILEVLVSQGIRAPMTIYRALDGLISKGAVHKIHTLNAFVVASQNRETNLTAFFSCQKCGHVQEVELQDTAILQTLSLKNAKITELHIEGFAECTPTCRPTCRR